MKWLKRTHDAKQLAVQEQAKTARARVNPSEAVRQASRVIAHSELNGWTRIAKELFST